MASRKVRAGTIAVKASPNLQVDSDPAGGLRHGGDGKEGRLNLEDKNNKVKVNAVAREAGGRLRLNGAIEKQRVLLDGEAAQLTLGGNGKGGRIALVKESQTFTPLSQSKTTILMDGEEGDVSLGGGGAGGRLTLLDGTSKERVRLDGNLGEARLGSHGVAGHVLLYPSNIENPSHVNATAHLEGGSGNFFTGEQSPGGKLTLRGEDGRDRILISAKPAQIVAGGNGSDATLELFPRAANPSSPAHATVHIDSLRGLIVVGGKAGDPTALALSPMSRIRINHPDGRPAIDLNGSQGDIRVGGHGVHGQIRIYSSGGHQQSLVEATIHLNGEEGVMEFQNADCAEDFQIEDADAVEPGTVLTIGAESRLQVCRKAYDKRVAGVVAGAGECRPGIILGRKPGAHKKSLPVALMGRVYCKVDSNHGAVEVGDLLTTSPTPGHAMKASDPFKAFGSVIGKALEPISRGVGMIPILVALQ